MLCLQSYYYTKTVTLKTMLTKSQQKIYFVIISSILLFIIPIVVNVSYLINNRQKVITKTEITSKPYSNVINNQGIINGTYPITFIKPSSDWNYRTLSDNTDFGKIKTMVFEIFKNDIIMKVIVVEEDLTELRRLEREGDQNLNVLDSVLEYKEVDMTKAIKINNSEYFRIPNGPNDNSQTVLNMSKKIIKDSKTSYLQSLDLFPEYTLKYRNSRLRTKINYLTNSEENHRVLDSIVPTIKLLVQNLNP